MDMMLTVSYSLKIPKDEFFYAESGRVKDEMKEQMEAFLPELKKKVEEASKQSEDFFHKESVKVYRNVQAAMTEELNKQTEALTALQKESGKRQKAVLPLTIIILLLILADIAVRFNVKLF